MSTRHAINIDGVEISETQISDNLHLLGTIIKSKSTIKASSQEGLLGFLSRIHDLFFDYLSKQRALEAKQEEIDKLYTELQETKNNIRDVDTRAEELCKEKLEELDGRSRDLDIREARIRGMEEVWDRMTRK